MFMMNLSISSDGNEIYDIKFEDHAVLMNKYLYDIGPILLYASDFPN